MPFVPLVTDVTVSGSPLGSESLANTETVTAVLPAVDTESFTAIGKRFWTVTVTVAVAVPPLPSEIVYVNVSVPWKVGFGV